MIGGGNRLTTVTGPLGDPVEAAWRLEEDGTALIEAAQACGLTLAGGPEGNDPLRATSRGVGELIAAAVAEGAERIMVFVGGVASTDGGVGATEAVPHPLRVPLDVACDVDARFLDAADVFAPQKGATPEQVRILRERLEKLVVPDLPGSGAAGGLAGGLAAIGARLLPGFDLVADRVGLDEQLAAGGSRRHRRGAGRRDLRHRQGRRPRPRARAGGRSRGARRRRRRRARQPDRRRFRSSRATVRSARSPSRRSASRSSSQRPWRPAGTDPILQPENAEASRQRTAHRLPPGPRRPARDRGRGRLPLPLANRLAAGRLPRRRPLLRPQRLPDHVAAARRVGGAEPDRPAPVLAAPRAPPPPRSRRRRARARSSSPRSSPARTSPTRAATWSARSSTSRTGTRSSRTARTST